jgi:hypothetical protein
MMDAERRIADARRARMKVGILVAVHGLWCIARHGVGAD